MTPSTDTTATTDTTGSATAAAGGRAARRTSETLGQAARRFWGHASPRLLAAMFLGSLAARLAVGDWHANDAVLVGVLLAIQPLSEWLIHVFILHWRPRRLGRVTIDHILARKHREHHADPTDPDLVFIPTPALLVLIPVMAMAVLAFPRTGLGLTWLLTQATIGLIYEWAHFLVHSDVSPRSRLFRSIWRHHRLHHYKNEHYWFAISATWPDHLLRTSPQPSEVATSPTVRALHASTEVG